MEEIWKDIDEFNGDYQKSNFGRVKSVARTVNGPRGEVHLSDRLLSQVVNKKGYIEYQITHNGKHYSRKAHRLVALAFIDNTKGLPQINHIDGNKQNNSVDNLEWCDNRHNTIHAYQNGLIKTRKVHQCDKAGNIIKVWNSGGEAARELNIEKSNIHAACIGKAKTYKGYVWKFEEVI